MRRHTFIDTPLAVLQVVLELDEVAGLYFPNHNPAAKPQDLGSIAKPADATVLEVERQLGEYLVGERTQFSIPILLPKVGFRAKVWQELLSIEYGHTRSYKDIAKAVNKPGAYRAVGTAVAHNPLSILVPCHRVIASDGRIGGYAGGVANKIALLKLERGKAGGSSFARTLQSS